MNEVRINQRRGAAIKAAFASAFLLMPSTNLATKRFAQPAMAASSGVMTRLLCKTKHSSTVFRDNGNVETREWGDKELIVELDGQAASLSIFGLREDGSPDVFAEAISSETQVVASKEITRGKKSVVLNRLTGAVRITRATDWAVGLITATYNGSCEIAANRKF